MSELDERLQAVREAADRLQEAIDALRDAEKAEAAKSDYGEPELALVRPLHTAGCLATTGPCTCWLDAS